MTNWEKLIYEDANKYLSWRNVSAFELPQDIFLMLKQWVVQAKEQGECVNNLLLGHIKEEYKIKNYTQYFENYILNCCGDQSVYDSWKHMDIMSGDRPLYLDHLWVNYQKKYEFNPPHDHSGVVSFVIFVQIPYDLKDEELCYPNISTHSKNRNHTSKFTFLNPGSCGGFIVDPLDVDKSFEGKMLMFSSKQMHEVYPFYTSDDYRITVSGNMKFKV